MKCIIVDDDPISVKVLEAFIQKTDLLTLANTFNNPISALSYITANGVDLIFLDIEMPEMNGIQFIQTLNQNHPQIILTTSQTNFAIEAYNNNVSDYLVKPFDYSRFHKAIVKVKEITSKKTSSHSNIQSLFVKEGSTIKKINIQDILWVESTGDYIKIQTKIEKIVVHSTLSSFEKRLPPNEYIRVHRSYIVRIDQIETIEDDAIAIKEKLIPIGKTYKSDVYKHLHII